MKVTFMTWAVVLAIAISSVAGCTVIELNKQVDESQERIKDKEQVLETAEMQQNALREEQQRLIADIDNKQMSLDDLNARLDKLQAENRRNTAVTQQQQEKRRHLDYELTRRKFEISQLRNRSDLPDAEKNRRIESLKREIRQQLELQLH